MRETMRLLPALLSLAVVAGGACGSASAGPSAASTTTTTTAAPAPSSTTTSTVKSGLDEKAYADCLATQRIAGVHDPEWCRVISTR